VGGAYINGNDKSRTLKINKKIKIKKWKHNMILDSVCCSFSLQEGPVRL